MKLTLKMNKVVENLTPTRSRASTYLERKSCLYLPDITWGRREKLSDKACVCVCEREGRGREHNIQTEIQKEGENHGKRQRQIKTEKEKEMGMNRVQSGQVPVGL